MAVTENKIWRGLFKFKLKEFPSVVAHAAPPNSCVL